MIALFVLVLLSALAVGLAWAMLSALAPHQHAASAVNGVAVWDEPEQWSALDDHQLDRLLREAARLN